MERGENTTRKTQVTRSISRGNGSSFGKGKKKKIELTKVQFHHFLFLFVLISLLLSLLVPPWHMGNGEKVVLLRAFQPIKRWSI